MSFAGDASSLGGLTWEELSRRRRAIAFWVLATGSIEQHGPHLPLGADQMVAERLAEETARRFSALRLPFTPLGVTFAFAGWEGTLGISSETYTRLLVETAAGAGRWCPRLMIVNAHDENQAPLTLAARELVARHRMEVVVVEWAELVRDVLRSVCTSKHEMHAGEGLTSLFLHWFPGQVRMDRIADGSQVRGGLTADDVHIDARALNPRLLEPGPGRSGVFGRPTLASVEKGSRIAGALIQRVGELVAELDWRSKGES